MSWVKDRVMRCCLKSSNVQRPGERGEEMSTGNSKVFGTIDDVCSKYSISRGDEVHTKVIDVPAPFKSRFRIDDILEPSRYLFLEFEGIHDSHYIGINYLEFYDAEGEEISYTNIAVDGNDVDHDQVQPAFPVNGWWAVSGEEHSLIFDFGDTVHVKEVSMYCANSASTPKIMRITDAQEAAQDGSEFAADRLIQLAGEYGVDPSSLNFRESPGEITNIITVEDIVNILNNNPPPNGFEGYLSECGTYHFVFYRAGLRTRVCNYFFGSNPSEDIQFVNDITIDVGVTIDDVAKRAMTLEELRAVKAIIVSNCVKDEWTSSYDGKRLRPDDVNLYDLNQVVIMPRTEARNCAFKELFGSGDSSPTYYTSHWWGEKVLDFITCCEYHALKHELKPSEAKYWVCAYANRQHDLGTDLGADPGKSSFNRAMKMSQGVLLVIDPNVVVVSRIWVDFELFRTIKSRSIMDVVMYDKGNVHLIAGKAIPSESPYQKNRREQEFPFQDVCKTFTDVELHKGEASINIDRVRIMNYMLGNTDFDDASVLKRIEAGDSSDPRTLEDMQKFSLINASLRAEFATKAVSVALLTPGQSLTNFYETNLLDIIVADTSRTELIFDDLIALDEVTDDVCTTLIGMATSNSEKIEFNVNGCRNVTEATINQLTLPEGLNYLDLNFGYARNIENDTLLHLATIIPPNLATLVLDVGGFKHPAGNYAPLRYNSHLNAFALNMPPNLVSYSLVTTLDADNNDGLETLVKHLPRGLKDFSIILYGWGGFKGEFLTDLATHLPQSLERISIKIYNGAHPTDDDFKAFANEMTQLESMKEFYLHTRSHGGKGFYEVRHIESISDMLSYA